VRGEDRQLSANPEVSQRSAPDDNESV
jgi:hypothetical protein